MKIKWRYNNILCDLPKLDTFILQFSEGVLGVAIGFCVLFALCYINLDILQSSTPWSFRDTYCYIDSDCYEKIHPFLELIGFTLKCRTAITFTFTSLTELYFFVALDIYILRM